MKGLVRISILGALIVAHQLLAPLSGPAQTPDPCPSPSPSPSPSPDASPSPAPGAGSLPSSPSPEPSSSPTPEPCPSPSPPAEHPTPDPGPAPSPDPKPSPAPAPSPKPSPSPSDPAPPPIDPTPPIGPTPEAPGPIPAPPPIFVPGSPAPATGGSPLKPPPETGDGVAVGSDEVGPIAAPPVVDRQPDAPFAISSPNSTAGLLKILSEVTAYGMPLKQALLEVAAPFPVAGPAWWIDDWHAPRSGGRLHQGLDIFAPRGTPLMAAADGIVTQKYVGALPGKSVEITGEKGVQFFYAHLEDWHEGLELGQEVKRGQVIGYVGNTGNAINTPPHLHFEYQPLGIPEPPKPRVDRWIAEAEERALALVERLRGTPTTATGFRLTRLFDLAGEGGRSGGGQLVPFAGSQAGLSSLEMANPTIGQMAWEIDWGEQTDAQLTQLVEDYRQYLVDQALSGLAPWPFEEDPATMDVQTGTDGSD